MYCFLTLRELQAELRKRNATVAGKKADLIERLEAYDRNKNFSAEIITDTDNPYICPPSDTFRDINADSPLPAISKHEIQEYFQRFNTHPKGEMLYESRHLLTARVSTDGSNTYLKGQCNASMKKVAYLVDVRVSQEGTIEECHCECAAGSGTSASCKHIAVFLLAAHDVVYNKAIKLNQACTQQLSIFNKPKKTFYHSPIAAQNLPSKRPRSCNYNPLRECDIMDNYEDYVRNMAIGYGESSIPFQQTYNPANPYGVEWDHAYINKTPQENILEELLLRNVTLEQIKAVDQTTRLQNKSREWHTLRSCRITAHKFHVVCRSTSAGVNNLVQQILYPKPLHTRAVTHGRIQEPIAIEKYEQKYDLVVERCGLFISQECPFLGASPDGLLGDETVIEVKCPFSSRNSLINAVTVPYLQDVNGHLQLKETHPYYAQVQGQLYCTNRKWCNFIIYTFKDIKVVYVSRNEAYIYEMLTSLTNFYMHHLEPAILNKYLYKDYLMLIKKQ